MFFCPNCNYSLSITEQSKIESQVPNENLSETPVAVSSSSQEQKKEEQKNVPNIGTLSNKAYFRCSNCGYLQEIEAGTLILSRASEKVTSDYIADQNKYRDMIYDMTLPHTRNYICPNKSCKSHNDHSLREAVWFKPSRYSYITINVCRACQTVW